MSVYIRTNRPSSASGLRSALKVEKPLVVPGAFDPFSALMAENAGFKAIYLSGAAVTGHLAMPDIGLITMQEMAEEARRITAVTHLPLIVDVDTGYGEALNVMRAAKEFSGLGAAAIQIEDQLSPKRCGHLPGKQLIGMDNMLEKIAAAREVVAPDGPLIIARTDARGVSGMDDAIDRGRAYIRAGADILFPEGLKNAEEFLEYRKKVEGRLLANMTEFGVTQYIRVEEFGRIGVDIVIFPVTAFRAAARAVQLAYLALRKEGTQQGILSDLMPREEFYRIIGYADYEGVDLKLGRSGRTGTAAERRGHK